MTVVAAYADGERVLMMSDTYAPDRWDTSNWVKSKIVRLSVDHRDALISCAGSAAFLRLAQHQLALKPPASDLDAWAYALATEITDAARERGHPLVKDGAANMNILLGFAGRLWMLMENDCHPVIGKDTDRPVFAAIGSGDSIALGALQMADTLGELERDPFRALGNAVSAACCWDVYCRLPAHMEIAHAV